MKLSPVQKTSMSLDEFIAHLKTLGYAWIGGGSYADVYAIPGSNYVCKVGFVSESVADDAYLRFLSKMPTTNPLFPKVTAVGIFHCTCSELDRHPKCNCGNAEECDCGMDEFSDYYVVHMERLAEFDAIPNDKIDMALSKQGLKSIYDLEDWALQKHAIKKPSRSLAAAIRVLKKLYLLCKEDIHNGNIMWRNHNATIPQMVITDPVA